MCVEKQPFLPVTGNHYHNVLVLGDGTYSKECVKTVSLISAHACPNGTHVIVVGIHQNITEREATEVAQTIMNVVKKSLALNNLIVDCDHSKSLVFMYKSQSEDHRSIKSKLQLMVKNCINTYYKCLEHHSQHYKNYNQTMANCPSANIADVCRKADNSP